MPNNHTNLSFIDNPSIKGRESRYEIVNVAASKTLKSWKLSLFSFEWLDENGAIRKIDDLPLKERDKRLKVEDFIKSGVAVERPVLGIGIQDNIEIGAGRDVFLTLAASGVEIIQVHIPISCKKDFKQFLAF